MRVFTDNIGPDSVVAGYKPLSGSWILTRKYRFNKNWNFCKGTQVSKIIATAKINARSMSLKNSTSFFEQETLGLDLLQDRRRDAKVRLFHKILSDDTHSSVKESFDIITVQQTTLWQGQFEKQSNLLALAANKKAYFSSFLPKTSWDLRVLWLMIPFYLFSIFIFQQLLF